MTENGGKRKNSNIEETNRQICETLGAVKRESFFEYTEPSKTARKWISEKPGFIRERREMEKFAKHAFLRNKRLRKKYESSLWTTEVYLFENTI